MMIKGLDWVIAVERYAQLLHYEHFYGPGSGLNGLTEQRWLNSTEHTRNIWRDAANKMLVECHAFLEKTGS